MYNRVDNVLIKYLILSLEKMCFFLQILNKLLNCFLLHRICNRVVDYKLVETLRLLS